LVFSQISLADGPGLCSRVSSIRPFYVHGVSTATILRPQGDPTAIIGDPDATVLRSLRPYGDSTSQQGRSSVAKGFRAISCNFIGDSTASLVQVYYVYCVLIASLLRCCCDYGDCTAITRRPNQDSARMQSFCDCFVHVQNIRRSATLCVLGFLATTSLRPCCFHGDCAASWVVARSQ